jgi:hypothetical protein
MECKTTNAELWWKRIPELKADKRMFEKSCQFQVHRMWYRLHPAGLDHDAHQTWTLSNFFKLALVKTELEGGVGRRHLSRV